MSHYLIQPRDTLIFRDGRPFGATGSEGARSLPFPVPSTTAGLIRTLAGQDEEGIFKSEKVQEVRKLRITGPFLVRLEKPKPSDTDALTFFLPAPRDALFEKHEQDAHTLHPLRPVELDSHSLYSPLSGKGESSGTPSIEPRCLVGSIQRVKGKPTTGPAYWSWPVLRTWLSHELSAERLPDTGAPAQPHTSVLAEALKGELRQLRDPRLGIEGPDEEARVHVAINSEVGTAREGALFTTRGRSFLKRETPGSSRDRGPVHEQLGLVVRVEGGDDSVKEPSFSARPVTLGGERRLSFLSPLNAAGPSQAWLQTCPAEIRAAIVKNRACRVLLTTPAFFRAGAFPSWLCAPDTIEPMKRAPRPAQLMGASVERPQVISGWDLARPVGQTEPGRDRPLRGRPKPTRRLARAGSVYFFSFEGWEEEHIRAWIDAVWMKAVSDDFEKADGARDEEEDRPHFRRGGFGVALLGVWSGQPQALRVNASEETSA
ncbi:MAG: type III-B CRISPR module-associated Cmr3 family protein [Myxococcota bacterium]